MIFVSLAGVAIICLFIPLKLISLLPAGAVSRILTIIFVSVGTIASVLADLLGVPLYIMKMTQLFPLDTDVKIIAHRGGGNEGRENTLSGLEEESATTDAIDAIHNEGKKHWYGLLMRKALRSISYVQKSTGSSQTM